jgi:voltage-gated potassium channel
VNVSDNEVEGRLGRRKRFEDSYGLVLLLLVISYFCDAALGDYTWGRVIVVVVLAAATWLALRASQVQRRPMRIAQALIPVLCVVAIASLLIGQDNVAHAVTGTISLILVVVAPVAIIWHLSRNMTFSIETFLGAVCVYLLIAQLFATLFAVTAAVSGHPFFVQTSHPSAIDYIYFSFVTITTVGYGDFTSALGVGKMLAMTEAVFGQLYLITVVSLVVQNLGARRQQQRRDGGGQPRA